MFHSPTSAGTPRKLIVFIGPAGSGKTSLTWALGKWIEKNYGAIVGYVNLDPGTLRLPYRADYDVREIITINDIMSRYNLGPNGAFIKSMDIMLGRVKDILQRITAIDKEYVLIDTPGQMELFVFRENGPAMLEVLKKLGRVVGITVFDPMLSRTPTDIAVLKALSIVIQLRLKVESILVVNKLDLLNRNVLSVLDDAEKLLKEIEKEGHGVFKDMALSLLSICRNYIPPSRLIAVSAKTGDGINELFDVIHEVFCTCGDLT